MDPVLFPIRENSTAHLINCLRCSHMPHEEKLHMADMLLKINADRLQIINSELDLSDKTEAVAKSN